MGKLLTPLYTSGWDAYELLDAGRNQKLERWGNCITIRPERQAYFPAAWSEKKWLEKAHLKFAEKGSTQGDWSNLQPFQQPWDIHWKNFTFQLQTTRFKHVGLFPEQKENWEFISDHLSARQRFLNLFAYTGVASLVARSTGAEVVHVDAIRNCIDWCATNQQKSGLDGIQWVVEDALKFCERERRRGKRYSMIMMDPPAFGLGTKKERWRLEDKIEALLSAAWCLLEPEGWMILNTYSPQLSSDQVLNYIDKICIRSNVYAYELWLTSTTHKKLYTGNLFRIFKI